MLVPIKKMRCFKTAIHIHLFFIVLMDFVSGNFWLMREKTMRKGYCWTGGYCYYNLFTTM